jgi:hypothetical protein
MPKINSLDLSATINKYQKGEMTHSSNFDFDDMTSKSILIVDKKLRLKYRK